MFPEYQVRDRTEHFGKINFSAKKVRRSVFKTNRISCFCCTNVILATFELRFGFRKWQ